MTCTPTREWLHRDVSSLEEAQRLLLDDHLAACNDCCADRERLRLVRELGTSLAVPPAGAREYNRAIARALLEGSPRETGRSGQVPRTPAGDRTSRWTRPWLWLAPAFAAAVALVVWLVVAPEPARLARIARPSPPAVDVPSVVDATVVEGVLFDEEQPLRVGDAIPKTRPLRTTASARVKLASLDVAIAPDSQIRWHGDHVVLDHGRVDIHAGTSARIVTERFEVELFGSATIDTTNVLVNRGSARVTDRTDTHLAQLEAGSTWQLEVEMPPESVPDRPRPRPAAPAADVAKVMTSARAQFAAGQPVEAERAVETLLERKLSSAEEAEARMFLADIAQATGNLGVAVTRYELVATKFADLPAAESALYAAARIEVRRGRDVAARALFDRYLDRYPRGRYADDVRQRRF